MAEVELGKTIRSSRRREGKDTWLQANLHFELDLQVDHVVEVEEEAKLVDHFEVESRVAHHVELELKVVGHVEITVTGSVQSVSV